MTFNDCAKQCKRIDMKMVANITDVKTAFSTGCGINSYEMWVNCKGKECE